MKHEYLQELFPNSELPFPFNEEGYPDFDIRDTYNLDYTFVYWLYERLRYFQDKVSEIIDFDYNKFVIDDEELTMGQCIDRMVKDCKIIILNDYNPKKNKEDDEAKNDLFKILSKVFWVMWW